MWANVSERILYLHSQGHHILLEGDLAALDHETRQKVTFLDEANWWSILDRWAGLDDETNWILYDPTGMLDAAIKDKIIVVDLDRLSRE
jgi:hypothetical protein